MELKSVAQRINDYVTGRPDGNHEIQISGNNKVTFIYFNIIREYKQDKGGTDGYGNHETVYRLKKEEITVNEVAAFDCFGNATPDFNATELEMFYNKYYN